MLVCNYKDCVCVLFILTCGLCCAQSYTQKSKTWVCSLLTVSAALIDPNVNTIENVFAFIMTVYFCVMTASGKEDTRQAYMMMVITIICR